MGSPVYLKHGSKLSKNILFYQNIICFGWALNDTVDRKFLLQSFITMPFPDCCCNKVIPDIKFKNLPINKFIKIPIIICTASNRLIILFLWQQKIYIKLFYIWKKKCILGGKRTFLDNLISYIIQSQFYFSNHKKYSFFSSIAVRNNQSTFRNFGVRWTNSLY